MKKKIFNIIAIIIVVFLAVLSCYYDSCNNGQHSFATMLSGLWSAAATVVLGFIAVWQNMQYKKLSDDYNDSLQMPEIYRTTSESDTILHFLLFSSNMEQQGLHMLHSNMFISVFRSDFIQSSFTLI